MSSDYSSSDSDAELDECVSESVMSVFNDMKQKLANISVTNAEKARKAKLLAAKHRLIYKTFEDPGSDTDDSDLNEYKSKPTAQSESTEEPLAFFIDKGQSVNAEEESVHKNDASDDVISFDLSNLDGEDLPKYVEDVKKDKTHPNTDKKRQKKKKKNELSSQLQSDLKMNDVYVNVDPYNNPKSKTSINNFIQKHKEPEVMKKSVISADFEKQDSIATTHVSVRQIKKERKLEREKTKGDKWYNLPATEISDERKHDIEVLMMRKALDPKRFYKSNDLKVAPKYFQFGKVVEDPSDFYSSRIPQKQRKSTIVEELLADSEFRQYNKRKYEEVQEAKRHGKGPYTHMKRLKKRKK